MSTPTFVRVFAPELWGQVDKFKQFFATTHDFKPSEKKAVAGVDNHFNKALTLNNLAAKLAPNLRLDNEELATKGYTAATNSSEFSAVIEGVFTELYSSIDCAHTVIYALYKKCRGVPDSTRKLFERAAKAELGGDFPAPLLSALQGATWFNELRGIRDELTHSTIGASHLNSETNEISYVHHGVRRNNAPLVIDNVFKKIDEFMQGVNEFLGRVFHFLNAGLKAEPVDVACAFAFDRVYMRKMTIADIVDFNSGICQSNHWFDKELGRRCPLADNCGAYARAAKTT